MRLWLLAALLTCLLPAALAAEPVVSQFEYLITRNGKKLGTQQVTLRREADRTIADISIEMRYKLGFITLFRYSHTSHEEWRGGQLIALDGQTEQNGEKRRASALLHDGQLQLNGTATQTVPQSANSGSPFPTTYWNADIVNHTAMFNTEDGRLITVAAEDLGSDLITVAGNTVEASHARLSGDLNIELWYSRDGIWLRSKFDREGAEIIFELAEQSP